MTKSTAFKIFLANWVLIYHETGDYEFIVFDIDNDEGSVQQQILLVLFGTIKPDFDTVKTFINRYKELMIKVYNYLPKIIIGEETMDNIIINELI